MAKKKVVLSLGGGGAKTFAHLGVIDALREANIPIDSLVTCSAASVVGFMVASGASSQEIMNLFSKHKKRRLFIKRSMFKSVLSRYIKKKGISDLSETDIPIQIITVDLIKGEEIVFSKGKPLPIVLASAALPGIFKAVKYRNYLLVDGAILNPDPADVARKVAGKNGAVISITLRLEVTERTPISKFNTVFKAFYLLSFRARDKIIEENSDIIIRPLDDFKITFSNWKEIFIGYFNNHRMKKFYSQGYDIGKKSIKEIKKLIS